MRYGGSRQCLLQHNFNILVAFSVFAIVCGLALIWHEGFLPPLHLPSLHTAAHHSAEFKPHPIGHLSSRARVQHSELLTKRTSGLHEAAEAYRNARGRHPPPGFDAWFELAEKHGTVQIEDLFSQIYHDLTPFWAVPAKDLRRFAQDFEHRIVVRNGTATATTYHGPGAMQEWMQAWLELVKSIEGLLPDLDMPVNLMDESRVSAIPSSVGLYDDVLAQHPVRLGTLQTWKSCSSLQPTMEIQEFEGHVADLYRQI